MDNLDENPPEISSGKMPENQTHTNNMVNKTDFDKGNFLDYPLLKPTRMIAWATIAAVVVSVYFYSRQVGEMEKATRLEWRPFLDIGHVDKARSFVFQKYNSQVDSTIIPFEIVTYDEFIKPSIGPARFYIEWNIKYSNSGKTPLLVKKLSCDIISSDDWDNRFDGDPKFLASYLRYKAIIYDTDFIIRPDTAIISNNKIKIPGNLKRGIIKYQ